MHKVLLGLDGSAESAAAAEWTADAAAGSDTLVIAAAIENTKLSARLSEAETDETAEHLLETAWTAPLRASGVLYKTIVRDGDADEELAALAEEESPDWLVIGAHGDGGDLVRSLAHRVHTPLIVVRGDGKPLASGRFVIGVDGSPGSRHALEWAVATARAFDAGLTAVFAYDPLADSYPHPQVDNWRYRGEDDARRQVAEAETDAQFPITFKMVGDSPVHAVIAEAEDEGASMVIVGKRSRHSLHGALLGRVPNRLMHDSRCPVALIPTAPAPSWWSTIRHTHVA